MNMIKEPLVSVIVPVYNVELYIDACLDSIKQQTYKNLEIVVVEDCSTDNSKQLLLSHLEDKRIKLIQHEKNSGLSAARNTGIAAATGEYIMFVDSDDIVDTRLVEACISCVLKTNAEVITYGFTPFEDGIAETELPYPSDSLAFDTTMTDNSYFSLPHFAWLKFIRSSVIQSSSLNFPVGLYYEDWPFHWHLGLCTTNRQQLPVDFYLYRQRGTSITGSTGRQLLDLFVIHAKVMALVQNDKSDEVKRIFSSKVRQSHWSILTRIDSEYLATALKEAKKAEKMMLLNGYKNVTALRSTIISTIIGMPEHMALRSLKLLRMMLHKRAVLKKVK